MKALETTLYTTLSGDTTLASKVPGGVHNTVAPGGAGYPQLIFQKVSGSDEYTWSQRIRRRFLYQVRVIDAGGPDKDGLLEALDRVDALLTDGTLTMTGGGAVIYCRRAGDLPDAAERVDGELYLQVGATYRIEVS